MGACRILGYDFGLYKNHLINVAVFYENYENFDHKNFLKTTQDSTTRLSKHVDAQIDTIDYMRVNQQDYSDWIKFTKKTRLCPEIVS